MGTDILNTVKLQKNYSSTNLLMANEKWAGTMKQQFPNFISPFAITKHEPHTFFLGCSDARYNESCLGYGPGEVFTVKTIANIFIENDISTESALEYAINCLGIKQIIICGHTDCGGINTCLLNRRNTLTNNKPVNANFNCYKLYNYLNDVEELLVDNKEALENDPDLNNNLLKMGKKLSELNVQKQINKLMKLDVVKDAVENRGIRVHGLIYNVDTGLVEKVQLTD